MVAIAISNPIVGLGTRVNKKNEWTAIDSCGVSGDVDVQQDSAKSKEITFCGINKNGPCTIHVGVFKRSTFNSTVLTTEINAATFMLFLHFNVEIPLGATFSIKELYMDKLYSLCQSLGDEPVVAVYVSEGAVLPEGEGYLDVIQRR